MDKEANSYSTDSEGRMDENILDSPTKASKKKAEDMEFLDNAQQVLIEELLNLKKELIGSLSSMKEELEKKKKEEEEGYFSISDDEKAEEESDNDKSVSTDYSIQAIQLMNLVKGKKKEHYT